MRISFATASIIIASECPPRRMPRIRRSGGHSQSGCNARAERTAEELRRHPRSHLFARDRHRQWKHHGGPDYVDAGGVPDAIWQAVSKQLESELGIPATMCC